MKIVRILDSILAKEQQSKKSCQSCFGANLHNGKAILACAFHGELSTNNPTEESAVELLK